MEISDYIYVDVEKIASIYSQITGGTVDVIERSFESSQMSDNKRHYDLKFFRHDAGGSANDKESNKFTVKPHHALIKDTEELLAEKGFLVDLTTKNFAQQSLSDPDFREKIRKSFCIKVTGRALIEDYERIKSIAFAFPEIIELVNKSSASSIKKSEQYLQLISQIDQITNQVKQEKDRNKRASLEKKLKEIKEQVAASINSINKTENVEPWILDGIKTWIETFFPGIFNLRIYPSEDQPDQHVFGHLKKQCFEDRDTNSLHFTYGSLPTENMTLIGIVTSVPSKEGEKFRPLAEFEKEELADYEAIESTFRGLFRGFEGLEQIIRTCRFPRILVYPLAVYRSVTAHSNERP